MKLRSDGRSEVFECHREVRVMAEVRAQYEPTQRSWIAFADLLGIQGRGYADELQPDARERAIAAALRGLQESMADRRRRYPTGAAEDAAEKRRG